MKRRPSLSRMLSIFCVLLIVSLLLALWRYTDALTVRTLDERRQNLEDAVEKGITGCYALEGRYPPDIAYLEDRYGLIYDRESFYIDYRPIGANIRPDVFILTLPSASKGAG